MKFLNLLFLLVLASSVEMMILKSMQHFPNFVCWELSVILLKLMTMRRSL